MSFPTPTNGIGVPLVVTLTGTGLVKLASQLAKQTTSQNTAPSGTQFAAWFGGSFPGGADFDAVPGAGTGAAGATSGGIQYGLTLSLSAAGGFASTCQLTVVASDTQGNTESATPVYVSYADPTSTANVGLGGNANWRPSTASTGFPLPTNFNGQCASVSGSGLITAISVGQAIIEVQVPFAGNTLANMGSPAPSSPTGGDSQDPVVRQDVYAQIVVQVVP